MNSESSGGLPLPQHPLCGLSTAFDPVYEVRNSFNYKVPSGWIGGWAEFARPLSSLRLTLDFFFHVALYEDPLLPCHVFCHAAVT
jgi:hypothetical protein